MSHEVNMHTRAVGLDRFGACLCLRMCRKDQAGMCWGVNPGALTYTHDCVPNRQKHTAGLFAPLNIFKHLLPVLSENDMTHKKIYSFITCNMMFDAPLVTSKKEVFGGFVHCTRQNWQSQN